MAKVTAEEKKMTDAGWWLQDGRWQRPPQNGTRNPAPDERLGHSSRPSGRPWSEVPEPIRGTRQKPLAQRLAELGVVDSADGFVKIGDELLPDPSISGWTIQHQNATERAEAAQRAAEQEAQS